jgi:hypothetical protein
LSRIQNNVSEWSDMSTRRMSFQWVSTIKLKLACWSSTKLTSSSSHWKLTCSRHDITEELLNLVHTHSFGGVRVAHHFCVVFCLFIFVLFLYQLLPMSLDYLVLIVLLFSLMFIYNYVQHGLRGLCKRHWMSK